MFAQGGRGLKIDMHIHSTASDGILKPSEIIDWAVKLGLKGVAITDHDTVDGLDEADRSAKAYKDFLFIPGIEFSTQFMDHEVHILGYWIDYGDPGIIKLTEKIKDDRAQRGRRIIEKLVELGYHITFEEVLSSSKGGAIGRPHIGRLLVEKGYRRTIQDTFETLLGKGKPAYIERFKLSPEEAIATIINAKGVPVLAHPGLLNKEIDIMEIISKGIRGIEVYHSKHERKDWQRFLAIAKEHGLFVTGGSDYHDTFLNTRPTIGSVGISFDEIYEFVDK